MAWTALAGCGGEASGVLDGGPDSPLPPRSDAARDGVAPPSDTGGGDSGDSSPTEEGGGEDSPSTGSCVDPVFPDGGQYGGCARAECPSGYVCVQRDFDVTSTAKCVEITPACLAIPNCACLGAAAQQCIEPGMPPQTDATPPFLRCQDVVDGGRVYLDFPCGCA
jgi:hypothetical protein